MAAEVRIKRELVDELLAGRDAKTVCEEDGLLDELKKALAERSERRTGPSLGPGRRADGQQRA
jgi:hypothetical protein